MEPSNDLKGCVYVTAKDVVFDLKKAVHQDNTASIHHHDAMLLKVFEYGSITPLNPEDLLSGCTSGESGVPFIIRYPGDTQLIVCMQICFE
jgi:hypothetical protein